MILFALGVALFLFASPPASQGALNGEHLRSGAPTPLSQGASQRVEASPEIPEDPWGSFFLTPQERAWLEELPPLLLGIDPAWPPMEFMDSQGVHSGISSSYVDLLRRALSIDIRTVSFPSWEKTLQAAKDGSVDMLSTAVKTPEREEFLLFSRPYASIKTLLVGHVTNPFVENFNDIRHTPLGIQQSSWGVDHISRNYPGISFRFYDSSREVLEGIRRREVAYGFINRGAFQHFSKMKRYAEIRTAFETPYPAEPSMALRKDLAPLIPMMDRFFSSLPATTHEMILERWINLPPGNLSPWKEVLPWLAWGGGLLLLLLGGILAWNRKLSREILRRRRAEEERREAHQMLQAVLENVPVCIYWKDIHSCYLGGNAAFLRYSGTGSQKNLVGKTDFAMPWKRSAPMLHEEDTLLLEERRPLLSGEREIVMEDQSSRWIRFAKTPLKDFGGSIQGVLGVFEDITEQKEIRLALQEREENYRNLFACSRDAILISDIESGLFLDGNPAALEMFQISSLEEFRRTSPAQLSTPVQGEGVPLQEAFERLMNELHHGGGYSGEWIHCRKDGTPFPVEIALSLFPYGGRECILGIVRDLSERARMEEELRSSREWLLTILDNLETVIFVKDREGRYLHANRRFLEVLGVSREETLGRTNEEIWTVQPIPNRHAAIEDQEALSSLEPIKVEHPIRHGDGSIHSYLTTKTPLLNHEGFPYALLGEARDISHLKEMQRQIERARNEAEKANQAKSEFLANMSHEIRTPLHAMIGMAHLLQETVISSEQRDYVMHIHRAGQLLIATINNILDLSKIEAQQMTLEKRPLDLEEILGNAATMLHGMAEEKDLFMEVHLDPRIPRHLQGDGMRLLQILNNLLSNAIKFTPKGYILLSAQVLREEEARLHIRITVSDTGIGIPKELQKKLFQAFAQADGSITRKYGGTGLGLTICRGLAQLMGGTIKLTSSPGRGSSFTLDLPFERDEASETLYEPFRTSPEKPRKILIASEDPRSSRRLSRYLVATGYEVKRTSTRGELAEAMEETTWDLLLLEERFHSAWPLSCLELRNIHAPGTPVILVGSKKSPKERKRLERQTHLFILERPLIPGELLEILGDILENRKPLKRNLLPSKHEEEAEAPDLRGCRVLVVEDNPTNRHLLRKLLEKRGLKVSLAENGEQGVQRVREEPFDAVLMDIQMPVMDGLEATRIIRKEEKSPGCRLPILAMTAHALSSDYKKSLDAGMDDHLTKPINPGELCAALGKWILKNKAERADRAATDTGYPRKEGCLASPEPSSDTEKLPEDLRSLQHIDLSRGLAIAEGNLELYRDLLQIFLEEFAQAPLQLQAFTEEKKQGADSPLLHLAHGLKGASANIGARDLTRSAAALVDHLRQVPPEPGGNSREMQSSLEEALLLDLQELLEELQRLASLTQK
jgi:PAS domain S-box-containing protein